ncbi:unnamed protein product [Miscanthus lutarioriparius]|uniref:60S ribosomal export protein NMD3 n=1 Tax=Miscanthus lutarioriparius TaxID=422564 RepID=A0A811NUI8_9POAL|nr:unnamed protein product [Miscanthus lutarioriparius]
MTIAESVPRHNDVVHCPACSSYLRPPRSWIHAAPDSAELMQILIRRVDRHTARHGVPTEPPHSNSKRLALRVRLRRETTHGMMVEEDHVAEFAVHDRLCDACGMARARAAGPDQQWSAVVQVRQRASHRRTLIHLDQQIVRHGAADSAVRVDGSSGGLDFYFASRSHAARLVEFVSSVAPARVIGVARQLVSHNNFRDAFSVELCAICRDDLIFLPREASRALDGLGPLVLCVKVSKSVSLLDTNSMRLVAMSIAEYDRYRFEPLLSSRRLVEYVVLDVELELRHHDVFVPVLGGLGSTYPIAWVQIARASDLGKNDTVFTVKTHIGWRLNPGDHVLGYDLCNVNSCNNQDLESYGQRHELPDAVLVKKRYKWSAGKMMQEQDGSSSGSERGCAGIEELAMGIGCIELNPSDDKMSCSRTSPFDRLRVALHRNNMEMMEVCVL